MPIDKMVVNSVLRFIRSCRKLAEDSTKVYSSPKPVRIREVRFSDFSQIMELRRRCQLTPDSRENWNRLWHRNPAISKMRFKPPAGWVLEADGQIVGYLANLSLLYRYGDRELTAVVSSALAVEPPYRAATRSLVAAFYRQGPVDLYLTTTAIEAVGKISRLFKAEPLPQSDYELLLFWVLRPLLFGTELTTKLDLRSMFRHLLALPIATAIALDRRLRKRRPRLGSIEFDISDIGIDDIGEEFNDLWLKRDGKGPCLRADRSPRILQWLLDTPFDQGRARILCCRKGQELVGYTVIRHESHFQGQRKSIIVDMIAAQDNPEIIRALFVAAYEAAMRTGSSTLEVFGFPENIRETLLEFGPYQRRYPACPFYYKAADPEFHQVLSNAEEWYATPIDGDTVLIRPSHSSSVPSTQKEDCGWPSAETNSENAVRSSR